MKKIKTFFASNPNDLDEQINEWIVDHEVDVVDIKLSSSSVILKDPFLGDDTMKDIFALVIYNN